MSSETAEEREIEVSSLDTPREVIPDIPDGSTYIPNRIFLNHVNTFNGRHVASFITDQVYGGIPIPGEGGDEEAGEGGAGGPVVMGDNFQVIGTLKDHSGPKTEDVLFTLDDVDNLFPEVMKCGVIIYDITECDQEISKALNTLNRIVAEFKKIEDIGPKTFAQFNENKIFILISSVLTWGKTQPLRPNDPKFVFAEEDYKKRRCHPNFKSHINCEWEVLKKGQIYPEKLKTYILCCGLIYGEEEYMLSHLFRTAWYNKPVPIFGDGNNYIPLLHIKKLSQIVHGLIMIAPLKPQYILAVERGPCKYEDIITALSVHLGIGKTIKIDQTEAFLHHEISQRLYDNMTVNLRMVPNFIVKVLRIDPGPSFISNIEKIVEEYRTSRKLRPYKILLHGPPAVGKTVLAMRICEDYHLHYVTPETATAEILDEWKDKPRAFELRRMIEINGGELPPNELNNVLQELLTKNICQNQGFVLDGFPKTTEEAKNLFEVLGGEGQPNKTDEKIGPNYVFSLEADDDFLCERLMSKPEEDIKDTKFSELNFKRRLQEFREQNTEDNTVLFYYDEIEVHPVLIAVDEESFKKIYDKVVEVLGDPGLGIGFTVEEMEQLEFAKFLERRVREEKAHIQESIDKMKKRKAHEQKMEAWLGVLEKLQMEEEKLLEARSAPLRHYLIKHVFPTLSRGLIEVVKTKPDDPVDYLAQFLFRENPEGKMFDPSYNKEGVELLESYTEL